MIDLFSKYGILIEKPWANPYIDMSRPSAGMLRYNGAVQKLEVYDGVFWQEIKNQYSVSLDSNIVELLSWVKQHRQEQEKLKELCATYPGIADLKEKLDLMVALVSEHKKENA